MAPPIYAQLKDHKPNSTLVFDDDGEPDVIIGGKKYYGGQSSAFARRQVEKFLAHPLHFCVSTPDPAVFDLQTNQFLGEILRFCKAEGITFAPKPAGGSSFFLVSYGVGLGKHIDALVEATNCYTVIFVDEDFEFLYHSLSTYNWQKLFTTLLAKKGGVYFGIDSQFEALLSGLTNTLIQCNQISIDGTACFVHRESQISQNLFPTLASQQGIFSGTGFFYDETIMLRNAYANLQVKNTKIFRQSIHAKFDAPVFVVASGPSLDDSIPFIKANADKAIIVSSGTTLRPLLVNGIVPDVQIELENIWIYSGMKELAEKYDLSSIRLVAASTVDQSITQFFENIIYFHRAGLSPYPLFAKSDKSTLRYPSPNIVNAALSFVLDTGFRNIYFFGTDLGVKEGERHHAKDHSHYSENVVFADYRVYQQTTPGNFGGQCRTSSDLEIAKARIADAIRYYGAGRQFFNCSNGALIEGAQPKHADTLVLSDISGGKEAVLNEILNDLPELSSAEFHKAWDDKRLRSTINEFVDGLVEMFRDPEVLEDRRYTISLVEKTMWVAALKGGVDKRAKHSVALLFKGTIYMMFLCVEYYLRRVPEPDVKRFAEEICAASRRILENLRLEALRVLDDPSEVPRPRTDAKPEAEDFIATLPQTWGKVPRNADCPCGSGRRYKHCHGKNAQESSTDS